MTDQRARSIEELLTEFHQAFTPDDGLRIERIRELLLREETREAIVAMRSGDRRAIAQELADVVYVAFGCALIYDIDLGAAITEVHRANMSKLGENGRPVTRFDGRILHGPNYEPPDLTDAITNGWPSGPDPEVVAFENAHAAAARVFAGGREDQCAT